MVVVVWPMSTRRPLRAALALTAIVAGSLPICGQDPPRFGERVDVARTLIDARVLDDRDNPIAGLTADDFRVKIGGRAVRVETATWVGGRETSLDVAAATRNPLREPAAAIGQGRLIVFLFQKDLDPSRIAGLMRLLLKSRHLLDTLTPDDRVAILSFDSRLKIWTDFTNEHERLDRVLARGLLFERTSAVQAASAPSLVERLDPEKARMAYGIERALELIGNALEPLPGSKSLVLFGHGFGRFSRSGVTMEHGFESALRALVAARTSVFSLDVTEADYHSLEAGLQLVSEQTGGFYARTHVFPDLAMRRLSGALEGYYVLFVETPERQRGADVDVELTRHKGRVLANRTF